MDLRAWGPVTVLGVVAALIVVAVGGAVVVIDSASNVVHPYTFHQYLDDLRWIGGLALAGAGIGRGIRLHGTPVHARRPTR